MSQCASQADTYRYEKGENVLVLVRCALPAGHAGLHTEGKRSWPTANEWKLGDPNQGDLWDAFSLIVSAVLHTDEAAEDSCSCGHSDHEHVHYCSGDAAVGSCSCNAEYARVSEEQE